MTPQEYINRGFAVSAHIDQQIINRAEADVRAAYITPIIGNISQTRPEVQDALVNLAFMLMTQRNVFVTRSGAKDKLTANSERASMWESLQEQAHTCHLKIETLRSLQGANKDAKITDICRIYFETNFINL